MLPKLMAMWSVIAFALLAVSVVAGERIGGWLRETAFQLAHPRRAGTASSVTGFGEMIRWGVVCLVVVLLFDWRSLIWGYFESDDFNFLIDNRTLGFPDVLYAVMNDHVFPLARILIRGLHSLFGVNAAAYNAIAVGSLAFLLWVGCAYLLQAGVTRLAVLFFVALCVGWTMWGEFTSGEYILLAYLWLMIAALSVGWLTMRGFERREPRYFLLTAVVVGAACSMNMSGFWVACAGIVFLVGEILGANGEGRFLRRTLERWPQFLAVLVPTVVAIVFYVDVFTGPTGPVLLSSAGERGGLSALALQWCYIITSAILSVVLPIPHHLVDIGAMGAAMALTGVIAIVVFWGTWSSLPTAPLRWRFASVLLVMSGVTLMVCLGRPAQGVGYVVPPKYLFLPYCLVCVAIAFAFDGWGHRVATGSRWLYIRSCLAFVLLCWSSHATASVLGGWGVPFFETTRGGEIREHRRERAALMELKQIVFAPLERADGEPLRIADIPGEPLCRVYPALKFPWGYQPQLSYFLDVLADDPVRCQVFHGTPLDYPPVVVPASLRDAVSERFLQRIADDPRLRRLYSLPQRLNHEPPSPASLNSHTTALKREQIVEAVDAQPLSGGGWSITSDGRALLRLRYPAWVPEHRHRLRLNVLRADSAVPTALTLSLQSSLFPDRVEHELPLPHSDAVVDVNLLQLTSFALSEEIDGVVIGLVQPGVYHVQHLFVE